MEISKNRMKIFSEGLRDGLPIGLGYLAVSFSLGIAARNAGLNPFQGFLASLLTIASAGEYAAFAVIAAGGSYIEMALTILITNLRYLLAGRKRSTTGYLKEISEDVFDRDGMEVYSMLINVGEKNDPEDDRLFYYDIYKPAPEMPVGTRVTVTSNDRLVASIERA